VQHRSGVVTFSDAVWLLRRSADVFATYPTDLAKIRWSVLPNAKPLFSGNDQRTKLRQDFARLAETGKLR
jgi:hypothetical protein